MSLLTYSFVKFGCVICIFLNSENLIVEVRISRSVSEGPFEFEITRVDCNLYYSQLSLSRSQRDSLEHFEISLIRHIRSGKLWKRQVEQPNFRKKYILFHSLSWKYILKILWKRREIAPLEQYLLIATIFCY